MKNLIRKNKFFIYPALLIFIVWVFLISFFPKAGLHISINQTHNPVPDLFFKYITYLGDGWVVLAFTLVLLFVKYRYVFIFLISNMFITIVIQVSKKMIFPGYLRPKAFFEGLYDLYLVPGVDVHSQYSFPSGHSATALGLFTLLAIIMPNRWLKLLWVVLGSTTAFSRVYLSQHFLVDILAGSIIGLVITFLSFHYFNKFVPDKLEGSLKSLTQRRQANDRK